MLVFLRERACVCLCVRAAIQILKSRVLRLEDEIEELQVRFTTPTVLTVH
jgi:hypothetical protein